MTQTFIKFSLQIIFMRSLTKKRQRELSTPLISQRHWCFFTQRLTQRTRFWTKLRNGTRLSILLEKSLKIWSNEQGLQIMKECISQTKITSSLKHLMCLGKQRMGLFEKYRNLRRISYGLERRISSSSQNYMQMFIFTRLTMNSTKTSNQQFLSKF